MADQLTGMMPQEEFLEHYGVKGMKWGKKRAKGPASADAARVNKIKKRVKKNGLDNLSNDDLAKLNKRNQLVADYKKQNPNALKKGHQATKEVLAVAATATAVVALGAKVATNPNVRKGAVAVAKVVRNS